MAEPIQGQTAESGQPSAVVSGVVFEDANENGLRGEGERGLVGISVSDGHRIVRTDASGRYRIQVDPERRMTDIVFVTIPSGYTVRTDYAMIPQFYRNLGELSDGAEAIVDFGLLRDAESLRPSFTFATLSDVHVGPGNLNKQEDFSGQLVEINNSSDAPEFIINTGDLTSRATSEEFVEYRRGAAVSRVPIWPVMGNHEFYYGEPPDWTQTLERYPILVEQYRQQIGPEWYSFDYGGHHFVALENTQNTLIKPDQLDWLREDLRLNAEGKEVVVLVHSPLNIPWAGAETEDLVAILAEYDVALVLAGHTHSNLVVNDVIPGSVHVVTTGTSESLDLTPRGFRLVRLEPGNVRTEFRMYGLDKSLTIVHPAPNGEVAREATTFQINAYDTSTKVESAQYRIDGGPWKELDRAGAFTWSDTSWRADELEFGEHKATVRVRDAADQVWAAHGTFAIVEADIAKRPQSRSDWPMFHGNAQHTGHTRDMISAEGLSLAWSYRTSGTVLMASPAIVDGVVFGATRDENGSDNASIFAVDLASGRELWRFEPGVSVGASPAVSDGLVFAGTLNGILYALDAQTGDVVWKRSFQTPGPVSRSWMYYSPTVADGVLYQGYEIGEERHEADEQSRLAALDGATGEILWTARVARAYMNEASPAVADGRIFIGSREGTIVCFDAETGEELWRAQPAGGEAHSAPAVAGGRVFMGFYSSRALVAFEAGTGEELWRYSRIERGHPDGNWRADGLKIPTYIMPSSPAVARDVVYMGLTDGNVVALAAETGTVLWEHQTDGAILSSPAVSGSTVYVGSTDGFLYGLDRITGERVWSYEIGSWVASSPAISGNTLVIGAWDGNLYAFTATANE